MYEGVHAHPDGDATVARHALTAAEYGYEGIVVRNHGDRQTEYDPEAVADAHGIDVVAGVELRSDDRSQLSGLVSRYRDERTIVCVHGGDDAVNRFACEQPAVDVLAHPTRDGGDFNHVLAKAAERNGVRVEFDLGPVLRTDGGRRVQALAALRKLREIVAHYDTPYVVSANPTAHLQVRAPRELVAVAEQVGFDPAWTREGLREWGRLAARNRDRAAESFLSPGVRLDEHEEDG
jgi:ribonuclease P/MRP protein subunit RPP1